MPLNTSVRFELLISQPLFNTTLWGNWPSRVKRGGESTATPCFGRSYWTSSPRAPSAHVAPSVYQCIKWCGMNEENRMQVTHQPNT